MTSKKCQGSNSSVRSGPDSQRGETNLEIKIKNETGGPGLPSPRSFANQLSSLRGETGSGEDRQETGQSPSLQSLLFPPAPGINPFILSSSIANMSQLLLKTDPEKVLESNMMDKLNLSPFFPGLGRPDSAEARKPAMTEALLSNLAKLNGSNIKRQETDNLRLILESVNIAVTRRLLEDNLLRWGASQQANQWAERITASSRHNSYDSDGNLSDDDSYLDPSERPTGEKKSRARSNYTEEQLSVLKSCYSVNQMPRREELMQISEAIGHPYKVVKVWFQNYRAKERKEGKLVAPVGVVKYPTPPPSTASSQLQISPASSPLPGLLIKKEPREPCLPLDLTTRHLSPSVTPPPLIVAEPEDRTAAECLALQADSLAEKMSKENFEEMIRAKLVSLEPDLDVAKTAVKKPEEQEEQTGVFNCDQCDKTFTKKSSITRHKYEHSGMWVAAHKNKIFINSFFLFRLTSTQMHRMREGFQTQAPLNRTQETSQRREALPVSEMS